MGSFVGIRFWPVIVLPTNKLGYNDVESPESRVNLW